MLRLGYRYLVRVAAARLIEQVQPVLVPALVRRRHHHRFHVVRVAHECHLLGVNRFLLADFTGLYRDTLWLHVDRAASALVAHGVVVRLAMLAALRRLLLGETHILGLHHIGRHAKRFLMVRRAGYRAHFWLLHHYVQ